MQLELFELSLEERNRRDIDELIYKHDQLRKSLHARISCLQKNISEIERELDFLTSKICREGIFL